MDRFSIDSWRGDTPQITDLNQIHHIKRVLRYKPKQQVELFDTNGKEYLAEIRKMDQLFIEFEIIQQLHIQRELEVDLVLYQGVCKGQKMDFIVQKATELGISSIYPCLFCRCMQGAEKNDSHKIERWRRIAIEASKQSKRLMIPRIETFLIGKKILEHMEGNDHNLIFYEGLTNTSLKEYLRRNKMMNWKRIGLVIGPEGGFERQEIEEFGTLQNGTVLTLGSRLLRTETAAIVATALVAYELSE